MANGDSQNKYGLSRKTNIAIAGTATIATAKDSFQAVVAIGIIVLVAITYQFIIDSRKAKNESA